MKDGSTRNSGFGITQNPCVILCWRDGTHRVYLVDQPDAIDGVVEIDA